MFRGISSVNLDDKGRIAIPSRYREVLEKEAKNQLVVTIDTEQHCLLLYPLPEWEIIEQKINGLPSFNSVTRRIQRLLVGHATEVELDNNGRILVPPVLREYANLRKQVMLIGQGKKFEIWDESDWQTLREIWLTEHSAETGELPAEIKLLSL